MKGKLKTYPFVGLALIAWGEIAVFSSTAARLHPLGQWSYTFFWYGYIFFLDGAIYFRKGRSTIMSRARELAAMLPVSAGVWFMFEWYNLYLKNWHYVNLPPQLWVALAGTLASYATVIPGVLFTSELLEDVLRLQRVRVKSKVFSRNGLMVSVIFGALCVTVPLTIPYPLSSYLFGFVWLGFFFLLDPVNYWLKGDSLLGDLAQGKVSRFLALLIGGSVCGFLWEFWNYWAYAKWVYDVPITSEIKLFEMPLLGYLGFPPFALEVFAIYSSLKIFHSFLRKISRNASAPLEAG